jgi:type I restriction enzyme, S subunit
MNAIPKLKNGFKRIKIRYDKFEDIPKNWDVKQIHEITDTESGATPNTDTPEYWENGTIPWINSGKVQNCKVVSPSTHITEKGFEKSATYKFPKNTVLIALTGATTANIGFLEFESTANQSIVGILPTDKFEPRFVYYSLINIRRKILQVAVETAQLHINKEIIDELTIYLPPLPEQEKIVSVLSNIDDYIENVSKTIEQFKFLKTALLKKILLNGIHNKKLKTVNLGKKFLNAKIPIDWETIEFQKALTVEDNPISLEDSKIYSRITVKRRHEGVVLRDKVTGEEILVKSQYKINSGDFVISKRQIIHNACGLIPKEFDGAVVSNEYTNLSGTGLVDINYFDLFAQTRLFKQTIAITTHGVDIEKYLFLDSEWLKLKMPVPPLPEQKKIIKIFSEINSIIETNSQYQKKLEKLKKGLMQQLLSGEVRVKI